VQFRARPRNPVRGKIGKQRKGRGEDELTGQAINWYCGVEVPGDWVGDKNLQTPIKKQEE